MSINQSISEGGKQSSTHAREQSVFGTRETMDKCTTHGAQLFHQVARPTWDGDGWTFTVFLFASGLKQLFRSVTRQSFDLVLTVPLHVQKVKSAFSKICFASPKALPDGTSWYFFAIGLSAAAAAGMATAVGFWSTSSSATAAGLLGGDVPKRVCHEEIQNLEKKKASTCTFQTPENVFLMTGSDFLALSQLNGFASRRSHHCCTRSGRWIRDLRSVNVIHEFGRRRNLALTGAPKDRGLQQTLKAPKVKTATMIRTAPSKAKKMIPRSAPDWSFFEKMCAGLLAVPTVPTVPTVSIVHSFFSPRDAAFFGLRPFGRRAPVVFQGCA